MRKSPDSPGSLTEKLFLIYARTLKTRLADFHQNIDIKLRQYTYIFYDEDGVTELKKETVDYGSAIVAPANPTKPSTAQYSYTFAGWDKAVPQTITADITFTATYTATPKTYTITFDSRGGSEVGSITAAYGSPITAPQDPQREHCVFAGWIDALTEEEFEFTTMPARNVSLIARWEIEEGYHEVIVVVVFPILVTKRNLQKNTHAFVTG
jgi:hypothetical protein